MPGVEDRYRPSWNVAPTTQVLAVRSEENARVLDVFLWGLVPSWARDPAIGLKTFNARAETVATKPTFRAAFRRHRIAVVAQGYYEWRKGPGTTRQPFYFERAEGGLLTFAGLYETWRDPSAGNEAEDRLRTCTIITTAASDDVVSVHDRMPAFLSPDALDAWLDPGNDDAGELEAMLRPEAPGALAFRPVSGRVGSVANNDPSLIAPVEASDEGEPSVPTTLF